jgi:hypothetical protein
MFEWAYIRSLACSYGYLFAQAAVEQNLLLDESSTGVHRIVQRKNLLVDVLAALHHIYIPITTAATATTSFLSFYIPL